MHQLIYGFCELAYSFSQIINNFFSLVFQMNQARSDNFNKINVQLNNIFVVKASFITYGEQLKVFI